MRTSLFSFLFVLAVGCCSSADAQRVFFSESFDNDAANFFNSGSTAIVDFVPTGGADGGGFVETDNAIGGFMSPFGGGPVLFRAQDEFNSSSSAFLGNYLAEGIDQISFSVRHHVFDNFAPVPINFSVRFSGPANFPGGVAVEFAPVLPGDDFTEITIDIAPSNPQFVSFEGADFNAIFSNIGHLQFGAALPDGFVGSSGFNTTDFTFALDQIVITAVPEPSSVLLGLAAVGTGLAVLRRRNGEVCHG